MSHFGKFISDSGFVRTNRRPSEMNRVTGLQSKSQHEDSPFKLRRFALTQGPIGGGVLIEAGFGTGFGLG
jgi:hypothetical protein